MAIDKKEFEKELEIAKKGAEVLKERFDKISDLEERIRNLERKTIELEIYANSHKEILGIHKENFESIEESLSANLSIMKDIQDRFRKHASNLDAHKE